MDHRHAAGLADAAAARARRTLPSPFYWAPKVSFAPGRAAMAIQDFHPDTREEFISVHDLSGSTSHQVYRGPAEHLSIGCLAPDEAVAIRSSSTTGARTTRPGQLHTGQGHTPGPPPRGGPGPSCA